ncbi:MAG TPA: acetyl-CoA hydrolase/transferase C-terminal domain-containing protein [Burkholderiales bacterium]|nr:acetyl-CoA hydrolase/transferase C-terminal domain-containing protein [Burkholderiales bacterium]
MAQVAASDALDLSGFIRPGDGVLWGQGCAEPQTLVEAFVAQRGAYTGARAFLGINFSGIVRPEHADHLRLVAYCGAGRNRALADAGALDILPVPYSQLAGLIRSRRIRVDVLLLQLSPPNARGEHSLGLAAEYLVPALEAARVVVAEINQQVPWTYSERLLRAEDLDLALPSSREPASAPYGPPGEIERRIAAHASAYVPDGATVETGLGALPDAVLQALGDRRDLGVHSGALGDGIVDLMRRGVITNARKTLDPGRTVGGALLGTRRLFDFAHDNPEIWLRSVEHTHDPRVLAQIPKFIAINSALEVDLTGQVNAEVANGSYLGAVGGAPDFVRAANQSPGGVSLIALRSSAGARASRIVGRLSGPVATPRAEAGVFVTEYGAADLRGLTLAERVPRMISIAHPAFREELERAAREQGLLAG